ncbi:MAG: hypothetical protein J0H00_07840 [Burkholderiales bacterium]|nr:hypothetical protein [Burkholderiales bacterium]
MNLKALFGFRRLFRDLPIPFFRGLVQCSMPAGQALFLDADEFSTQVRAHRPAQ